MKMKSLFKLVPAIVLASPLMADEVDESGVTAFEDGTPAVAAEVNANFQALIDAINDNATRITALESSAGSGDSEGFDGNYIITGVGMSSDCSGDTGSSMALTLYGIHGSATASDGTLSFTLTEEGMDPILRDDGVGNFEVVSRARNESDSGTLTYSASGVFEGIDGGGFSADGSTFNLMNVDEQGCPGDVTFIVGTRS